jgi:hypothetical protein
MQIRYLFYNTQAGRPEVFDDPLFPASLIELVTVPSWPMTH